MLIKIISVLLIAAVSALTAGYFINNRVSETVSRQKTLAEALAQSRLAEEMKKAEEAAQKELEAAGVSVVTEILETKPPLTEPPETATAVNEPEITVVYETETAVMTQEAPNAAFSESFSETSAGTEPVEAEPETSYKKGGLIPEDRTGVPIKTVFTLTGAEREDFTNFLIDHYFLDGYKFANAETDEARKAKKTLAADMEYDVSASLNAILDYVNISDITSALTADYPGLISETEALRADFMDKYSEARSFGEEFGRMYDGGTAYFDRLIRALGEFKKVSDDYKNAANPLLAVGIVAGAVDSVLFPEMIAALESSFDLVEISQGIFLEGTQGEWLLTREEVSDIIINPGLIYAANES